MLKRRLIPKLQLTSRSTYRGLKSVLVVTRQFDNRRAIGDPLSQAKIYEAQLADELFLLNIQRTSESWTAMLETLTSMSCALATPLSVGGGIDSLEKVQILLDRGADKVVLNTSSIESPYLIEKVANKYGSQCVVVSIDFKCTGKNYWSVLTRGGTHDVGLSVLDWSKKATSMGAGELVLTSIDRDGTGLGLDLDLIKIVANEVDVPVIASGGCGLAEHFVDGYLAGASGVAAGTFFSQRDQNPMQCRSHIRNAGLPIRLAL